EAVEAAIKVARYATKKQNVIVFQGSFHGRTIGAMSLTTSKTIYKTGFGPLMVSCFKRLSFLLVIMVDHHIVTNEPNFSQECTLRHSPTASSARHIMQHPTFIALPIA